VDANLMQADYLPWQSDVLNNALTLKNNNRLPHAILLESSSNQDMSSFVQYLSMLLLCDTPQGIDLCGICSACRMMSAHSYSDFNLVTLLYDEKNKKTRKNIKIEQIRDVIHKVFLSRQYDRLKIAAIYPAETMSNAGANSLLKTLEEPTAHALLLLATHNKGRIPVTIRSRCHVWSINLPDENEATNWLAQQGVEQEDIIRYLQFANGDPVLALELKTQNYASTVEQFKSEFSQYLRGETSVAGLCKNIISFGLPAIRRLINMMLTAYCYQLSGVDAKGNPTASANKVSAQAVLGLQLRAQKQLQIEENNLDLQLQLEDVLISFKQIITRRMD
jgi:DNA polymerase-3 subunit delta'